jgi:hypothetical protein
MKNNRRRSARPARRTPSVLERIQVDVAGIDCGASEHFVAVPPDRDPAPIQSFRTFTADLERLADWLVACRVTSVATIDAALQTLTAAVPASAAARPPSAPSIAGWPSAWASPRPLPPPPAS